jgi:tetratricopeptide (TPR) repeat protein
MKRGTAILFWLLVANSIYLLGFPAATVIYMGNVLLHLGLGIAFAWMAIPLFRRRRPFAIMFAATALAGIFLAVGGNTTPHRWALVCHAAAGFIAAAIALWLVPVPRLRAAIAAVAVIALAVAGANRARGSKSEIRNPIVVPVSMEEEAHGPKSPFFPSSSTTNTGAVIPSNFFLDSESCGRCHKDIYEQWKGSMHHFASFNNQFYRKSIEYMQDVVGTQPSKWCAGCHDHALFFNGRFDRPIKDQIDTVEARAGLACTSCHAIVHVGSSIGNGDFTIGYPPLHELASSRNRYIQALDYFLTYAQPEPHRRTFMKPFMRNSAEFCSACHKVHLDLPVNHYRWVRGFNDYDNWQASGVSGQGARSFYYPQSSSTCSDCHMPLVPSHDPGNHAGKVHSHRFPAANMAVAYANQDRAQMEAEEQFLKSGFITVDIFAVSPAGQNAGTAMLRRGDYAQPNTTFAVGEEAEQAAPGVIREVGHVAAPVDRVDAKLKPGAISRVDVVVRTRKIGHFFPGGTVDAFDVWLELQAKDADGRVIFWSGRVEDEGRGAVEPGAHYYRSYQLDGGGNPINKRNAWQARSLLYARLIPPGAADVAHFLIRVPADSRGPITLAAKLNYRKFSWYYTHFAYAGEPRAGQDPGLLGPDRNALQYDFVRSNIPGNVSGQIRDRVPDLPIVTLAQAAAKLAAGEPEWKPSGEKQDRERWNDWGIGLLQQGDLKGAEYAFKKVTEADPGYADGWLNVARVLIREGQTDAAKSYIARAVAADASLGRIYFFRAMIEKADGDYDAALLDLDRTLAQYPRDRVVANQAARILFLKRQYAAALKMLERVCDVDPEDVQMHYTMMLCYRGLGDASKAAREQALFQRFKADEASQAITGVRRRISAEDNNEAQEIHDHESVDLAGVKQ